MAGRAQITGQHGAAKHLDSRCGFAIFIGSQHLSGAGGPNQNTSRIHQLKEALTHLFVHDLFCFRPVKKELLRYADIVHCPSCNKTTRCVQWMPQKLGIELILYL